MLSGFACLPGCLAHHRCARIQMNKSNYSPSPVVLDSDLLQELIPTTGLPHPCWPLRGCCTSSTTEHEKAGRSILSGPFIGAVVSELGLEPSSTPALTCVPGTGPCRHPFLYLAP